ncbi:target of rapamycin complex 2 subunit MAPKAP1 [Tetranychus urticae]|uniref:Target of rapamycin complex 2 subunit MAPKAP1 n=1 Tax=Tetranychus urticae TaxID=32264 RepID=T1K8P8_TETUR|nr:target of rapamycin complex 2 subunit MAPKAP1 [Tetranychus urticae]
MAFFDDKRFLLSHIRHSFITCDPTEMCEMVMLHEPMPHYFGSESDIRILQSVEVEAKSELLDATQSCEIVSDIEMIGAHRGRSNTAQRLERLKEEKRAAAKTKYIHWRDVEVNITDDELSELFPRKSPEKMREASLEASVPKKSVLSFLVEKSPDNPFKEYAKFDARVGDRRRTRNYEIILHSFSCETRLKTLQVVIFTNARVRDLIGLTCWLYTNEINDPKLEPNVNKYCLRIAEDNGEIDTDFPALNPDDIVEKYEFRTLAMVEASDDTGSFADATPITSFSVLGLNDIHPVVKAASYESKMSSSTTTEHLRTKSKQFKNVFKKFPWKGDSKHKKDNLDKLNSLK